jgi:hypothetical protein
MIAHHALADGMALVFLIRALLQVLSGGKIEAGPILVIATKPSRRFQ